MTPNHQRCCRDPNNRSIINSQTGTPFATETDLNPLAITAAEFFVQLNQLSNKPPAIIAWSGTLADSIHESNILNWQPSAREQFSQFCTEISPFLLQTNTTLLFRTHAHHILSDVPSCLTFINDIANASQAKLGLALSPANMLTQSMLETAEDHLTRMFQHLGKHASALYWPTPKLSMVPDNEILHSPSNLIDRLAQQHLNPSCLIIDPPKNHP